MVRKIDANITDKIINPEASKTSGSLKGRAVKAEMDSQLSSISLQLGARVYEDPEISKICFKAEKASESGDLKTLQEAVSILRGKLDQM